MPRSPRCPNLKTEDICTKYRTEIISENNNSYWTSNSSAKYDGTGDKETDVPRSRVILPGETPEDQGRYGIFVF